MIGQTISHYRIVEELGAGAMGVVYKAEDVKLGRFVALKFLPDNVAKGPQALSRFQREAKAASALNHPNICTIHEIDEAEGRTFIAMELLEGADAPAPDQRQASGNRDGARSGHRDRRCSGRFPLKGHRPPRHQACQYFCHQARPRQDSGFRGGKGLSSLKDRHERTNIESEEQLTTPGIALGTAAYMSPEQVRAEELDGRTDLFSFGIVLYQMATGKVPFQGASSGLITEAILNRDPVAPMRVNPDIPPALQEVIWRALEKDRNLRYQHAADMRAELQRLKRDTESGGELRKKQDRS